MAARGAQGATLRVQGLNEFLEACALMPKEVRKDLRSAFRDVGERVRKDSAGKTEGELHSPRSAGGYRTVVRARGVSVEQSLRKTTGLRPKWGGTQMRESLIPALYENEDETLERMEEAMQQAADYFELVARWQSAGLLPSGFLTGD